MSVGTDNSSLASSLTDLMTSLAVIFVLLLVASLNNMGQKGRDTRNQMVVKLKKALLDFKASGVEVETDPKDPLGLLVLVPEKVLRFDFNEWQISKGGDEFLQGFTPRLSEIVCSQQFREEIQSIIVEGHASSEGSDQTNFEISQKRSGAVVTKSLDVLGAGGHLATLDCFAGFVSAAGRGKREPVFDKATHQEDRDASRRVIFKIRIRSIEQRDLPEIIGGVQATAGAR